MIYAMKSSRSTAAGAAKKALIFWMAFTFTIAFWAAAGIALFLLAVGVAHAGDFYATGGFGKAMLRETQQDNLWQQNGFDHVSAQHSNAWKLGVGLKLNRYLSAELDYRDLGQFNSDAIYVDDSGHPGNYNAKRHACDGPCSTSFASWQHGTTRGIGLSIVAAPDWDCAPFLRAGAFYHRSTFTVTQMKADPAITKLSTYSYDPRGIEFSDNKIGPMVGAGVRYKFLDVEWTYYPKAGGPASPYSNISTVLVSARLPF